MLRATSSVTAPSSQHTEAKPAVLTGGMQCRVLCGPATATVPYQFDDVALLLFPDRLVLHDAGEFEAARQGARVLISVSFSRAVIGLHAASTRRGIAIDVLHYSSDEARRQQSAASMALDVMSDVLPPSARPITSLQLSFASTEDRAQAFALLQAQWERAKTRAVAASPKTHHTPPSPAQLRSRTSYASDSDPMATDDVSAVTATLEEFNRQAEAVQRRAGQLPSSFYEPAAAARHRVVSGDTANVLNQVHRLRAKARELLTAVRRETGSEGLTSDDEDGKMPLDVARVAAERATELAASVRDGVADAAAEIAAIQMRRARRQAAIQMLSPSTSAAIQRDVPLSMLNDWMSAQRSVASQPAPNECKHCRDVIKDTAQRAAHQATCSYRKVRCNACGIVMRSRDVPAHRKYECVYGLPQEDDDDGAASVRSGSSTSSFASITPPGSPATPGARPSSVAAAPPRSPSEESRSKREREKERIRRVLEQQAAEQAAAAKTPTPRSTPRSATPTQSTPKNASTPRGASSDGGALVMCPYCHKEGREAHVAKCAYRPVRCNRCGENLVARDAKKHVDVCPARR